MLTNLAFTADLFHSADGTAFADLMIGGHRETWPVRSTRLRSWLRQKYYQARGAAAGAGAISAALNLLEARAENPSSLIDPNAAPVRTAPREERDLFIAAGNGHLLAFDNLSDIAAWASDALCRMPARERR
jgi:hypothetical protein